MKIQVLIKETVDTNAFNVTPEAFLPKDADPDEILMNQNDKHAIEAALVLKEKHGGTVQVITIGSDKTLREAIAMGADEAVRINPGDLGYLTPLAKGEIIANAVKKIGIADMIVFGMASVDFGQSQLPGIVAAKLDLPQLTYANTLTVEGNSLQAGRYVEGGSVKVKAPLPCVVSVASTANEPRYTSVKRILLAKKTTIPVFGLSDIGINPSTLNNIGGMTLKSVEMPKKPEVKVFKILEEDAAKAVDSLISKLKADGVNLGGFKQ